MNNPSLSPFESIRQMAADVILNSTDLLVINSDIVSTDLKRKLNEFRSSRSANLLSVQDLSPEDELGLSLFFNAVNFCYRDPASGLDYQYRSHDGRQLRRTSAFFTALSESGIQWNDVRQVAALEKYRWIETLQLKEPNRLYLGLERRERITGLAQFLLSKSYKTVTDFVAACQDDVLPIAAHLVESGFFKDEFLKRAQVGIKMLDSVLSARMQHGLAGMDLLTCMADYRIPQVFYNLGAVDLSPALHQLLESEKPVLSGSREELALRASVIVIGCRMSELMNINEAEVDTLLWEYSQVMVKNDQMKIPHMLVATDKY